MTYRRYIFIFLAVFLSACSTTKFLPPGQKLYTGGEVKIQNKDLKKSDAKAIIGEMESLLRPQPNAKILGLRYKLWIYEKTKTPKKNRIKTLFEYPPGRTTHFSKQC
jgi:outer membrane protein insertion porin family